MVMVPRSRSAVGWTRWMYSSPSIDFGECRTRESVAAHCIVLFVWVLLASATKENYSIFQGLQGCCTSTTTKQEFRTLNGFVSRGCQWTIRRRAMTITSNAGLFAFTRRCWCCVSKLTSWNYITLHVDCGSIKVCHEKQDLNILHFCVTF